jgi:signal transduction histidine kinase
VDNFFSRDRDRIQLSVPDSLWINVDEARATLMLKNLVSNALRYSSPEDGPVHLEFELSDDAWIIRVRDHGPGIPDAQIEFIGEPFYRGDPSRTRHTGGSGLGLYLARLVAEAHDGTLELDRSYRDGACFVVTLPFELRH